MKKLQIKALLIFIFLSVFLYLLDSLSLVNPVKSLAETAFLPGVYLVRSLRSEIADTFAVVIFWKTGESRVKNLEQRNLELQSLANRSVALEKENSDLRQQLGYKPASGIKLIPATVLGTSRFMSVGIGSRDGVRENMSVVYLNNLVGRVVKVTPRASYVELPTDTAARIPAKVGIKGTARGLVIGQFNTSILLDRLSQSEEVKVNDLVFSTGEGDKIAYEPDLLIGKISSIDSKETDLFKKANVNPLINYDKLTTVFVVAE